MIAREVTKRNIDFPVMGDYGHSRARNLILGSTTSHLIRACHFHVILFR